VIGGVRGAWRGAGGAGEECARSERSVERSGGSVERSVRGVCEEE
jgi:hypothetical protein